MMSGTVRVTVYDGGARARARRRLRVRGRRAGGRRRGGPAGPAEPEAAALAPRGRRSDPANTDRPGPGRPGSAGGPGLG